MTNEELYKLFSTAINRENEAYEFYHNMSLRVLDEEVKEIFSQLAQEELLHKETIEKFKKDPSISIKISPPYIDYEIAETTSLGNLHIGMNPAEALLLAIKKEQQSLAFYRSLASYVKDKELKETIENFANMELTHKHRLENIFIDIRKPESL